MCKGNFDLKKMQQIELDMLKSFIFVCEKYKLRYFLLGGTCLGTVRHKGFIPWDDDIDVGMPRPDYEKFVSLAQKDIDSKYFIQTFNTDREYPMTFAKMRNSETTYIEQSLRNLKINHGVYIDIFPLDGEKNNYISQRIFDFKKTMYDYRISRVYYFKDIAQTKRNLLIRISKKLLHGFYILFNLNLTKTILKREKLYKKSSYDDCEIIANYGGAWGKKEVMPKQYFGNGTGGIFEGISVVLPENYDAYLSQMYGDYMKLPPPEKRVGHHHYEVADMEKSYRNYV